MRLDRYLSQVTTLSRSQARNMIRAGRVRVDGHSVKQPANQVNIQVEVVLDERTLGPPQSCYYMLNKPLGVVCATQDPSQRTVMDLLDILRLDRLHIVGRLDIDASGLLLLTDDGQWSHRITAPVTDCTKTYWVTLTEPLTEYDAGQLRRGIHLKNESKPTRPATIKILLDCKLYVTITEGKYHQVKRMFAALGNRVESLHRVSIGRLKLDETLGAADYRPLSPEEVALF
ncbi:MAG: pseudouridine synthase [Candidatus Thiodiazotropha sp. (ex Lucinoma aequizonata)]|nr:pseudouridine synthase [Candidatus Thiodiazotropha sp. (ex Lucinoma aequizonata)]MCU7890010.1 pseudouridine synthase [Candidatus Thiodiazotropha sp. (ex Lucinoma aequizonata)]MCU7894041.1 pseudouridine synthase [Candidatus Thiodiazotropha sp. (ex Lucinoma aequizonata)]MCU7899911.1 pseudouridine synthase [Candidatus Thiodiazotropha sp. (ex Lucinoma aequizonata)]MCU7904021.1 pseudouridine synthase [Candidatus Thiodiazotropha sp. (ex Lucinoma aequizonata)]